MHDYETGPRTRLSRVTLGIISLSVLTASAAVIRSGFKTLDTKRAAATGVCDPAIKQRAAYGLPIFHDTFQERTYLANNVFSHGTRFTLEVKAPLITVNKFQWDPNQNGEMIASLSFNPKEGTIVDNRSGAVIRRDSALFAGYASDLVYGATNASLLGYQAEPVQAIKTALHPLLRDLCPQQ